MTSRRDCDIEYNNSDVGGSHEKTTYRQPKLTIIIPGGNMYYFISQWQNERCLYDVNDDDYHLKEKRNLALNRILENMSAREFAPLPTIQNLQD